jgi:hypothetical protein
VKESLHQRFKREYLGQLVLTAKRKGRKLKPREVVLLGAENSKRIDWPLAVAEELIPGRDGEVRLLRLRTASESCSGQFNLEVHDEEQLKPDQLSMEMAQEPHEMAASFQKDYESNGVPVQTRSGREVKLPSRFHL